MTHAEALAMCDALRDIRPGQVIVYHRGDLAHDRCTLIRYPGDRRSVMQPDRELTVIAELAWELTKRRKLHLVQRRIGIAQFHYLAIGSSLEYQNVVPR